MQLGLRFKLTMVMTGLVFLVSLVLSLVFLDLLLQQVLDDTNMRAKELARDVFDSAKHAIEEARAQGLRPTSDNTKDTRDYVQRAFEISDSLQKRLESAANLSSIREISILDGDDHILVAYPPAPGLPDRVAASRPPIDQLVNGSFVRQLRALAEQEHVYAVDFPFLLHNK